ncbi:hypothetical protein ABZ445_16300 [Streptomyces chartreusis]|uniref:hypothetical protein n=1 Tax=Streptomyces chartreusis TaxID=1969 RepID=UPI0033D01711
MAAKLTDAMTVTLSKLARDGHAFAGVSTFKALERRGLVTANTDPRDPSQGVRCLYMLTDAGLVEAERPHHFEFGSRRRAMSDLDASVQWFDHCKVCDGKELDERHLR